LEKSFEDEESSILVGTELAFNYLKNSVPLAIIASLDSLFTIPNFKITEKILEIILSTGNLASDKFIIETKNPDNEIINAFKNANLLPYIKGELKERRELEYPPYKRFVKISFWGEKDEVVEWLEASLLKGDEIIVTNFHVEYLAGRGRSGQAFMAPGLDWRLNQVYRGTKGDNWLTRGLQTDEFINEIASTVFKELNR